MTTLGPFSARLRLLKKTFESGSYTPMASSPINAKLSENLQKPVYPRSLNEVSANHPDDEDAALDRLVKLVGPDMKKVNHIILERMHSPVEMIPQLAGYIVASGGKRLRPMLTVACARLCGYDGDRHHKLAACVEFIHTATLLHDDVVDESALRRGQSSANEVFGNKASVLVGDFLFSRAFELMVEDGDLKVLEVLSRASSIISEGEVLQLMTTSDLTTDVPAYLRVIEAKTAALFTAACEVGGLVAKQPEDDLEALRIFGQNLGIAFQIADDVLDYSPRAARLGKTIGDDFREGKMTLPVVFALKDADADAHAFWERTLGRLEQEDGDLNNALALMERTGALPAPWNTPTFMAKRPRKPCPASSPAPCATP